jgi:putative flippase GtrA
MSLRSRVEGPQVAEIGRFVVNGLIATLVHYSVLTFNLRVLGMSSAGMANFVAAWFGIATSFAGSRYFVFRRRDAALGPQALRFLGLYAAIACLHGLLLHVWTDQLGFDYSIGFLIGTAVQTVLSYIGNKLLVFSRS